MNLYHDNLSQLGLPYVKINDRLPAELDISTCTTKRKGLQCRKLDSSPTPPCGRGGDKNAQTCIKMGTIDKAEKEALPLEKGAPLARLELATHGLGIPVSSLLIA